jgi:hypothetical protein
MEFNSNGQALQEILRGAWLQWLMSVILATLKAETEGIMV